MKQKKAKIRKVSKRAKQPKQKKIFLKKVAPKILRASKKDALVAPASSAPLKRKGEAKKPHRPTNEKVTKAAKNTRITKSVVTSTSEAMPTENGIPPHLTTPSPTVLKAFRAEAKRRQELARKYLRARSPGKNFLAMPPKNGKKYSVDLRIHSPGTNGYFSTAGVETGAALVRLAKVKGIDIIGLTDYYNASYIDLVRDPAQQANLTVVPGFDLCCQVGDCRDVHAVALFPESFGSEDIYRVLSKLSVPKEMHGSREYCLPVPFREVLQVIEENQGVLIPSRIDKTPYRQGAIRALIEEFGFHAFDLAHPENTSFFSDHWPTGGFSFFSFSNANALAQVGSRVAKLKLEIPGFAGIKALVKRRDAHSSA